MLSILRYILIQTEFMMKYWIILRTPHCQKFTLMLRNRWVGLTRIWRVNRKQSQNLCRKIQPHHPWAVWDCESYFICHAVFIGRTFICSPFDGITPSHLSIKTVFTEIPFHACYHRKWKGTVETTAICSPQQSHLKCRLLPIVLKPSAWGRACWSTGVFFVL